MAVTLVVNNIPFDYPEQGEQAPWGEAATGWAQEVTTVLNAISGPYDILETSANIVNNQTSYAPIPGFFFDPANVRSFEVSGNIYRTDGATDKIESFIICGLNLGSSWSFTQEGMGDAEVTFDIDPTGQVNYISSNFVGQTSGLIKFKGFAVRKT
jgi:hypothetical protein